VPGQIGLIQATEAIKLILKKGKPLVGQFLIYHSLETEFKTFPIRKNPSCPLCNEESKIKELTDYHESCSIEPANQAATLP
jgi:molybdopterin/thiamine biosynthesis adenylyltransferase